MSINKIQKGSGQGLEYEFKFLNIDVIKTRKLIKKMGGKLVHKRMKYIRKIFHRCNEPNVKGFARVRREDGNVTMTVKTYANPDFPLETEIVLAKDQTFEDGVEFMRALALKEKAHQESYREKWNFPNMPDVHEVTFDELPGLPVYTEVDCKTKEALEKVIKMLKLNEENKRSGSYAKTYNEYYNFPAYVLNNHMPSITFANIEKEVRAALRFANKDRKTGQKRYVNKQKALLKEIALKQKNY